MFTFSRRPATPRFLTVNFNFMDNTQKLIQYIFIDVVRFTQGRNVESQVEMVGILNDLVTNSLLKHSVKKTDRILIPTGDGICICLLKQPHIDLPVTIALTILSALNATNAKTKNEKARFEIRVGVNQNHDNIVIDINGRKNVAGRGINMSQRIMNEADGGQLLVGESVYDVLCERTTYQESFLEFHAEDKHGKEFRCYQVILENQKGLNTKIPKSFAKTQGTEDISLSKAQAYFIVNTEKHKAFIKDRYISYKQMTLILLFHFLAEDCVKSENNTFEVGAVSPWDMLDENGDLSKSYEKIEQCFSRVALAAQDSSVSFSGEMVFFFEVINGTRCVLFPNAEGLAAVKHQYPYIHDAYQLG